MRGREEATYRNLGKRAFPKKTALIEWSKCLDLVLPPPSDLLLFIPMAWPSGKLEGKRSHDVVISGQGGEKDRAHGKYWGHSYL